MSDSLLLHIKRANSTLLSRILLVREYEERVMQDISGLACTSSLAMISKSITNFIWQVKFQSCYY